ncbi:uncharacterized protein MYCFIDRAFT_49082 [Pseudocercospora fijiensis CIRAD86]|uniref:SNF2 family DNA-dependent ATPase domain-containing protein n=1 Tax=Pseudocercospora fijiensis (strain CIRAD86) TaxID=383855 RepID=N1Q9E9_PSEFD|nr:uncharacterized protein MYCFIDRAFT_49082 [Pseudocercospora fijiensis CIRAD86]EME89499.1 hypothetical protein MYCFIDRAFT_49082 [Pseudocercospora fijiensis CIRAD86]
MPPLKEKDSNVSMAGNKHPRVESDPTNSNSDARKARKVSDTATADSRQQPTPPQSSVPSSSARSACYNSSYGLPNTHSQAERNSWLADEDANEVIASTQFATNGSDEYQHYGDISTKVVGVRYYSGYANPGEHILIRREPGNQYDSNAIRIDNVAGTQIGHIPRGVAAKLARYIDSRMCHFEGQLAGEMGSFDCPLTVHVYGPDPSTGIGRALINRMRTENLGVKGLQDAERVAKRLEKEQQEAEKRRLAEARRAAASGAGAPSSSQWTNQASSSQANMSSILETSHRIDPRAIGRDAEKLGASEDELKAMPMAAKPHCIKTEMLPYQLQALQWLLDQESPKLPDLGSQQLIQLWKADRKYYTNLASGISTQTPGLASGGILADDMGLGKTLQMIALVASESEGQARAPTLVVAPVSVLSNWSGQAQFHTHDDRKLSVYTYHASGRVKMKAEDFSQYDIVLTTYGTLASDFGVKKGSVIPERKLRSSGLYSVEWRRIILDEGHSIRNPATKAAAAAMGLIARSRWVLTGTPIVNSLKDLFSLLRFVGITGGLDQLETFNAVLVRPLKSGSSSANNLLQAIMRSFTLRRRKDMAFVDLRLPKLDEYVHGIDFTRKEQERYDALTAEAKGLMRSYDKKKAAAGQSTSGAYNHLLEVLLRMRQCCNHWQLCGERVTNLLARLEVSKNVELTAENKKALQDVLRVQMESSEDCAICLDTLHQPVITTCGHAFGRSCIEKVIETQAKCPMCRAPLKDDGSLVEPANEYGDERGDDNVDLTQSSSKVDALVTILAANQSSGNKTIVFSQWTRFLDMVKSRLDQEGYKCCRLDGTMNVQQRDKGMHALENDAETGIMLASLGASAVGLNLTAANIVVLCDTWWAPAIEDQAVDRVHRLGQKKAVKVFRLVMNNTIEQHTLDVQKDKRKLMMMAFSEQQNKRLNARAGRIDDIRRLLA